MAQGLAVLVWSDEWEEDWEMHIHECQLLCRREAEEQKEACEPGPARTGPGGKTHRVQGVRSTVRCPDPLFPAWAAGGSAHSTEGLLCARAESMLGCLLPPAVSPPQ